MAKKHSKKITVNPCNLTFFFANFYHSFSFQISFICDYFVIFFGSIFSHIFRSLFVVLFCITNQNNHRFFCIFLILYFSSKKTKEYSFYFYFGSPANETETKNRKMHHLRMVGLGDENYLSFQCIFPSE